MPATEARTMMSLGKGVAAQVVAAPQMGELASVARAPSILVIDDDLGMRTMMAEFFDRNDIRVRTGVGLEDVTRHLSAKDVNLIMLDLRLGRENGLDVLREIRSRSDIPVIITSGSRREEIDRVVGLELGADDYVTKPFGLHELLARTRAVLRRAGSASNRAGNREISRFANWQLDRKNRRLTDPDGELVALTKGEFALLCAFLDAPQRLLTREQLLNATRVHEDVYDRSIDVQILRLRRKLEREPSKPQLIRTERGLGYVFTAAVETT